MTMSAALRRLFPSLRAVCLLLFVATCAAACAGDRSRPGSEAASATPVVSSHGLAAATPAVLPGAGTGVQALATAAPADATAPNPTTQPATPSATLQPSATATRAAAPVEGPASAPGGRPIPTPDSQREAFIQSIVPYAQAEQADSGVPASFSLALAASETGWGASPLMKQHNSFHGLSCSKPNEGVPCVAYGDGIWNAYSSPLQAFLWAGRWLRGHPEFAPAFEHTDDVETFTRLVARCYISCGGPFPQKFYDGLMEIVDQYDLRQYDKPGSTQ